MQNSNWHGSCKGLGAGAKHDIDAAADRVFKRNCYLSSRSKYGFITAGMGGGTGTGASHVITGN